MSAEDGKQDRESGDGGGGAGTGSRVGAGGEAEVRAEEEGEQDEGSGDRGGEAGPGSGAGAATVHDTNRCLRSARTFVSVTMGSLTAAVAACIVELDRVGSIERNIEHIL